MTRKRSTKIKLALAAAAIAAAGLLVTTDVANARPHPDRYDYGARYYYDYERYGPVPDSAYDRNGDGVLSYRERLVQRFDRDGDGRINNAEQRAYQDYKRGRDRRGYRDNDGFRDGYRDNRHNQLDDLFESYDRNADGYLSFGESNGTPLRRHFRSLDRDVNGYLSWYEIERYLDAPQDRPIPRQPAYRGGYPGRLLR